MSSPWEEVLNPKSPWDEVLRPGERTQEALDDVASRGLEAGVLSTPSESAARSAVDAAIEATPLLSRLHVKRAYEGLRSMSKEERALALPSMDYAQKKLKAGRKQGMKAAMAARRAGMPEKAEAFREAQRTADRDEKVAGGALESIGGGLENALGLLDAAHHKVRQWTAPGDVEGDISNKEWNERLLSAKGLGEGPAPGTVNPMVAARKGLAAAPVYANPFGAIGAVGGGVMGAITGRGFAEGAKQGRRDADDLLMQMITDPLSYISFGSGSASKNAASVAARAGTKAGLAKEVAKGLGREVGEIMSRVGGTVEQVPAIKQAFKAAGLSVDDFARAFGKGGEFIGRGQLRANLPFLEELGVDVLPKLTGKEFSGGKAIQKVAGLVESNPFDQTVKLAKNTQRTARGLRSLREQEIQDGLEHIAHEAQGLSKERMVEILKKHMDPDYDPIRIADPEEAKLLGGALTQDAAGNPVAVLAKDDYLPRSALSPQEQKYVDSVRSFLDNLGEALKKEGVIENVNRNPLSGMYFPRQYKAALGFMDELPEGLQKTGVTDTFAKHRGDVFNAVPLGREGGNALRRAETDTFKALDTYGKQTARARAAKFLEEQLADQFAKTADEIPWEQTTRWGNEYVELADGRFLPTPVHNVLKGTFDTSFETMGRAIKHLGKSKPWARALGGAFDWYARAMNRFKRNALVTRPGYHLVNFMNDSIQMFGAGVNNPVRWMKKARDLVRRAKGGDEEALKMLREANAQNIATGSLGRLELYGDATGKSLASHLHRIRKGKRENLVSRGLRKATDDVASWWEDTAKLSMYLWGRSKGESPANAAAKAFETLLDYQDRGKGLQIMRWFIPFANWMWKAPKMAVQQMVRRPARVLAPARVSDAISGDPIQPRRHLVEQGQRVPLGPMGQDAFAMLPGLRAKQGFRYSFHPRLPHDEAFNPFFQASQNKWAPLALALDPLAKGLVENLGETDLFSKRKMIPSTLGALFPKGSTGIDAIEAEHPNQIPWFSRYAVPNFMLSPPQIQLANQAFQMWGEARRRPGEEGTPPMTTIGSERPIAYGQDLQQRNMLNWLNMATAMKFAEHSPVDFMDQLTHAEQLELLSNDLRMTQQLEEEKRRQRRRR